MAEKTVKIEHLETNRIAVYGGFKIMAQYSMRVIEENGASNTYLVDAEIRGITTRDLFLEVFDTEAQDNNEYTLTEEAVKELFEQQNS